MKKTTLLAGILVLALTACTTTAAAPSGVADSTTPAASVPVPESASPAPSSRAASESESTDRIDNAELIIENEGVGCADDSSSSSSEAQDPHYPLSTINSQLTEPPPSTPTPTPAPQPAPAPTPAPQPAPEALPVPAPQPTPDPTPPPSAPEVPPAPVPEVPLPAAPQTAYDAPYDIGVIAADAASYGASLGMTWSDALSTGNCSWEAPITTSSTLSGDRLRTAIQSGVNRVLAIQQDNGYQAGEFLFEVYLEPNGAGEYAIYFLMG